MPCNKIQPSQLLTGPGSGLDADTVDGIHASGFETAGAVAAHEAAVDPHPQYQKESERGIANGYAALGSDTIVVQRVNLIQSGILSARPAVAVSGQLYFVTDLGTGRMQIWK
jgi:hypothetical protein